MLVVPTDTSHRRYRCSVARPPEQPQLLAPEDMKVRVKDRPPGVLAGVEDQPVPGLVDPLLLGHRDAGADDVGQLLRCFRERLRVLVVSPRYHQYMHVGLWVDVPEGIRGV